MRIDVTPGAIVLGTAQYLSKDRQSDILIVNTKNQHYKDSNEEKILRDNNKLIKKKKSNKDKDSKRGRKKREESI